MYDLDAARAPALIRLFARWRLLVCATLVPDALVLAVLGILCRQLLRAFRLVLPTRVGK